MPTTTIDGRTIQVDDEGYLTEYADWNDELAVRLAGRIGIELTDAHRAVLQFLRNDYRVRGETPTLRRVAAGTGVPVKQLFALFPGKPAKKMAYIAGLPKPRGCV